MRISLSMKDAEKKKISNANQTKRSVRSERRDRKLPQENPRKTLTAKETEYKSPEKSVLKIPSSDSKKKSDSPVVYEDVVIHYVDDVNRSEEAKPGDENGAIIRTKLVVILVIWRKNRIRDNKRLCIVPGDSHIAEEEKIEKSSTISKRLETTDSVDSRSRAPKVHGELLVKTSFWYDLTALNLPSRQNTTRNGKATPSTQNMVIISAIWLAIGLVAKAFLG